MHVIFFTEEPSMEAALINLLPKLLPTPITFQFIVFQGKQNLLQNLAARLRGYANWLPEDYRIVVLVDEDRQNCLDLKAQMEGAASLSGLKSKSQAGNDRFQVLNRISIEELEAWFFGDVQALCQAYPKLPPSLAKQQRFRDPDAITGGTWETLEKTLQSYGYYLAGYPKIEAARQISAHMDPARNRSHSFRVFCQGLQAL